MTSLICPELLQLYYGNSSVRRRMTEFLGGSDLNTATAIYVTANDGCWDHGRPAFPRCLPEFQSQGLDVERSLWDKESLIADLDLDYENFDSPAAAYLDPQRTFKLEEPVFAATSRILGEVGIQSLDLVSGRGFHLVWRIPRNSKAFHRLAALGQVPYSLSAKSACLPVPTCETVEPELARAFAGLGMVLEFVAHRVLRAAAPRCSIPVEVTSIEVGPGNQGREIISFDLSEYGDPLQERCIRLPFSTYLKPRRVAWAIGEERVRQLLPLFEIPLAGMRLPEALAVMRNPAEVIKLSQNTTAVIPDESSGTLALIEEYSHSELAAFHKWFYSMNQDEARRSTAAHSGAVMDLLPRCTTWILDHANDWLLKPAALQHVTRILTALNWHPRSIAEFIRDGYEADYGWGNRWARLDPSWRAEFYTRLFTGLIATGCDQLVDLNCVSHKEKGYCAIPECRGNLVAYQEMVLQKRSQ